MHWASTVIPEELKTDTLKLNLNIEGAKNNMQKISKYVEKS